MRLRRQLPALQRRGWFLRRQGPTGEIHLLLRKTVEGRLGKAKILREQRLWRMTDPIADAERAKLREIAVVKDQDEVAGLIPQALQHVTMAARKQPYVARPEIVGLSKALWVHDGRADPPLDYERPFRRRRVPMQLAHCPGLHPHRDAGDPLRNRQLLYGSFLPKTFADHLALRLFQGELERRQFLPGGHRVRDVVHKARIAGCSSPAAHRCCRRASRKRCCRSQKFAALEVGHR